MKEKLIAVVLLLILTASSPLQFQNVLNGLLQNRQFQHPTHPKSQKIRVKFSVR